MQADRVDRFDLSRRYLQLAQEYLVSGDLSATLESAANAAINWRNWREPFCLIAQVFYRANDIIAAEKFINIAIEIPRPEQSILIEDYYHEQSFNAYVKSIASSSVNNGNKKNIAKDKINLILGGDVLLGRQMPGHVALRGSEFPFKGIAKRLREADLVMVNLESCTSVIGDFIDKGGRQPYYYHNHPEMLKVLIDAGIQVVCTGNNHAMDYDRDALAQQCEILDDCGFVHFGAGRNAVEAAKPAYVKVGDWSIAFIGIETETPYMQAKEHEAGIHYAKEDEILQAVAASIALARSQADIIIVSPHWGKNWLENSSKKFQNLAKNFIDLGANAVLGHSAHILQGVESYRGCPIVYDMGTLLFDRVAQNRMRYSALYELEITSNGIQNLEVIPVKLTRAQANIAIDKDAKHIRELIVNLSQELKSDILFEEKGSGLSLKCTPKNNGVLTPNNATTIAPVSLPQIPNKYLQLKSNVLYEDVPNSCAWKYPVLINNDLEVLGSQYAKTVRPQRGFVCDVFFRANPPQMSGRWEACISATNWDGEVVFEYKHPIAEGIWPVERWDNKEVICDHIVVRPVVKASEGKYCLFWHLLDLENKQDMPVQENDPRIINGKVFLGEIAISEKAPPGVAGVAFPIDTPFQQLKNTLSIGEYSDWLQNSEMIKEGWQCRVYFFEHHVIKVLKSFRETWEIVEKTGSGDTGLLVEEVRSHVIPSIDLLSEQALPAKMFNHFEVLGKGIYLQRRGENMAGLMEKYVKQNKLSEIQQIINNIAEFIVELWRYGLSDESWKFESNYGVNNDGQVVLLDCLEITADIHVVREQLRKKTWRLRNKRFFNSVPEPLAKQLQEILLNSLTPEKLSAVWGTKTKKFPRLNENAFVPPSLSAWKNFDKRQLFRFFVDGRHHKRYSGWRGYEKNEAGSTVGMLNGYSYILDNFDLSCGITFEYIKGIHKACLSGVDINIRTFEPGEIRYLITGFMFRDGKTTTKGIEDTWSIRQGDGTPLFRDKGYQKTTDEMTAYDILNALKKEKELRYCPWYPTLSAEQTKILKERSPVDEFMRLKSSVQEQIRQRGKKIIDRFNQSIVSATSDNDKLLVITRLVRDMELLHPFHDGNCRTLATVMMNHLLMYFDLSPAIIYDPNLDAQYSVEEYAEEIRKGMECTKRLLANPESEEFNYRISEASQEDISDFLNMAKVLIQKIDRFDGLSYS